MANAEAENAVLRKELAEAKDRAVKVEAEAEARVQAAKKQLQDGKEKAKVLFGKKVTMLQTQLAELQETLSMRESENEKLKTLMRESETQFADEKKAAVEAAVAASEKQQKQTQVLLDTRERELAEALRGKSEAEIAREQAATTERKKVADRVADLEQRLHRSESEREQAIKKALEAAENKSSLSQAGETPCEEPPAIPEEHTPVKPPVMSSAEALGVPPVPMAGEPETSDVQELQVLLASARTRIEELEAMNARASAHQFETATCTDALESPGDDEGRAAQPLESSDESGGKVASTAQLGASNEQKQDDGQAREATTRAQAQTGLTEANAKIAELEKTNDALRNEVGSLREELAKSRAAMSPSESKSEVAADASTATSVLEQEKADLVVKVSELEKQVAAKQAEIGKVRDKARSYLKDLNAEKRETEAKMRSEMAQLTQSNTDNQNKVRAAKERSDELSKELDACLGVITEKQSVIQSLNMTITQERTSVAEGKQRIEELNNEFALYKERACKALEERDAALGNAQSNVQAATVDLQRRIAELEGALESANTGAQLAKKSADALAAAQSRADEAETKLQVFKTEATTLSSSSIARIDALADEVENLKDELEESRAAVANAEGRHATALLRLEASERALNAAEVRAEEAARQSTRTLDEHVAKIKQLEESLARAEGAAIAAQRTAAAAALAMTSTDDNRSGSPRANGNVGVEGALNDSPDIISPSTVPSPYETAPGVMENTEDRSSVTWSPGRPAPAATSKEMAAKDDQIAVLLSQIAELGSLLEEAQEEAGIRTDQAKLLKDEVRELEKKLVAAQKLHNGAPFDYMKSVLIRYIETGESTLVPVLADVVGFSEEEQLRVSGKKNPGASGHRSGPGYLSSIPFLGSGSQRKA